MTLNMVKVGSPVEGRQKYESVNPQNNKKVVYSIPVENADKFEKLAKEADECAKSIDKDELTQKINNNSKNMEKKMGLSTLLGGAIGAAIPAVTAILVKGSVVKRSIIGGITALLGAGVGAVSGMYLSMIACSKKLLHSDPALPKLMNFYQESAKLGLKIESEEN